MSYPFDRISVGTIEWYSIKARAEYDRRAGSRLRQSLDVQDQDVSTVPQEYHPIDGLMDTQVREPGVECAVSTSKERQLPCPSDWVTLVFGAATLRRTEPGIPKDWIGAELRPAKDGSTGINYEWPLNEGGVSRGGPGPRWVERPLPAVQRAWTLFHRVRQDTIARWIKNRDRDLWARMNLWAGTPEKILGDYARHSDWKKALQETDDASRNALDNLRRKLGGANGVSCAGSCTLRQRGTSPEHSARTSHSREFPWDVSQYHTHDAAFQGWSTDVCIRAEFRCTRIAIVGVGNRGSRNASGEYLPPPEITPEDSARLDRWPEGEPLYASARESASGCFGIVGVQPRFPWPESIRFNGRGATLGVWDAFGTSRLGADGLEPGTTRGCGCDAGVGRHIEQGVERVGVVSRPADTPLPERSWTARQVPPIAGAPARDVSGWKEHLDDS